MGAPGAGASGPEGAAGHGPEGFCARTAPKRRRRGAGDIIVAGGGGLRWAVGRDAEALGQWRERGRPAADCRREVISGPSRGNSLQGRMHTSIDCGGPTRRAWSFPSGDRGHGLTRTWPPKASNNNNCRGLWLPTSRARESCPPRSTGCSTHRVPRRITAARSTRRRRELSWPGTGRHRREQAKPETNPRGPVTISHPSWHLGTWHSRSKTKLDELITTSSRHPRRSASSRHW